MKASGDRIETARRLRIGVVSDTHSRDLPEQMLADFRRVDLIVHAGDFCDVSVYESLKRFAEVEGVCGNMDGPSVRRILPERRVIVCGGRRIGVWHGSGSPHDLLDRVRAAYRKEDVDVVIFGHSHRPLNETIDGVLYFNPGSPNDYIFAPYRSYGLLEIDERGVRGRIVKVREGD